MGLAITLPSKIEAIRVQRAALQWVQHPLVVQRNPPIIVIPTCLLVLFSAVDAGMTMTLLPLGAVEWNPLMRELIERDPSLFVHMKLLMTSVCALTLATLSAVAPARKNTISRVLLGLVGVYVATIVYEVFLLRQLL